MIISKLNIEYENRVIFKNFIINFKDNKITAILGPSGCGKTTLLNSIAFSENDFQVSYIFQEPRLLPWCTLEKNIMLVLNGNKEEKKKIARKYLEKVGLENRAGEYPGKLSGGERQRVAIARAFSFPAPVLLMDEPFQSQDPALKQQLIELVKELQAEEKRTILYVTHDVSEAASLADHAVVLNGRPAQIILDIPITRNFEKQLAEVLVCQKII